MLGNVTTLKRENTERETDSRHDSIPILHWLTPSVSLPGVCIIGLHSGPLDILWNLLKFIILLKKKSILLNV